MGVERASQDRFPDPAGCSRELRYVLGGAQLAEARRTLDNLLEGGAAAVPPRMAVNDMRGWQALVPPQRLRCSREVVDLWHLHILCRAAWAENGGKVGRIPATAAVPFGSWALTGEGRAALWLGATPFRWQSGG